MARHGQHSSRYGLNRRVVVHVRQLAGVIAAEDALGGVRNIVPPLIEATITSSAAVVKA